ncbi:transcriptional regulatory protein TyrR [Pasteurella canis]|uniref:sigma 54-interacting transcriptional regulator n=1 Tax=Pasteurella canis TaxID=753 RepID=UPI000D85073B|nr:sigma 54-interacting transcriptional regulator [Pasteurella canis]GJJ80555.1 transcriptional regulatory protein TyrR [Pasteurella canis]SPY33469.1 transcriptional regulatory protein TyrR [Pasteurella canis]
MSLNKVNNSAFTEIVAKSPKMENLLAQAIKFSASDAPLLIQGETGTGKDLIAKSCHLAGPRSQNKFIAVNCAGLPSQDAESEMFGRRDNDKEYVGFFEYANGGTVLLDSIAELSLELQAKLLRFLNDGTFRRVGEEQEHYANVRVICTSQIPLQHYVDEGKMRSDLFHRLNVLTLNIPSLRERKEDIPDLVNIFVAQISEQLQINKPYFSEKFIQYLQGYPWTGNVRELHNALYRACSLAENDELTIAGLNLVEQEIVPVILDQFGHETLEQIMNKFEASVLRKFYEQYPSTRKLAVRLGISHTAIANKLRQYGISK